MNFSTTEIQTIFNANEAASAVLNQALEAAAQGTFAVGGMIVDNQTGNVICAMHNNVLKPLFGSSQNFTFDPTAHGERQLVYWYYANRHQLNLPDPEYLTIITTLDPCAMCAGTLLTAGFNVGVIAIDDFAGINYNQTFNFDTLPPDLRPLAKRKFGYYACGIKGVDPDIYVRGYVGGPNVAFKDSVVSVQNLTGCNNVFQANVEAVRNNSSNSGKAPQELFDPAALPDDAPVKLRYRELYADAFRLKIDNPRLPDKNLLDLLLYVKGSNPTAQNAVALLDPFGNVVLCMPDTFENSPVETAFMNVTQAYAITRYQLMNDPFARAQAYDYLTHPKYGTFVFLNAPNPADARTIMTLGAYGSTMEGPVPQIFPSNFQYYFLPQYGTEREFRLDIMNLPPFYTQLAQLSAMQVANY
ncbi:nucleoside deaminase [Cytophaga hutchinsonii]|uniref:Cytosine/adenosine deaminase n=1 Tax=Cytophaga hutchinsonii (strain ATCC 33406 / DSM 1761 / CIP 103989 / NBRC 15051 / NCIMB 9469 / D465) TaxID=269798 RepID=A0A6N4SSW5_CYTH3|nr:nucleoside deaminase [Cytophaga hutchinsonii]ABG59508.1 cytosine/adenosine deaminase [Cytophaga hutchinsonii ATCC 33406]SFX94427.1 cytosine deaminase [Cytophaga hutchinsonii ATCC 33406]